MTDITGIRPSEFDINTVAAMWLKLGASMTPTYLGVWDGLKLANSGIFSDAGHIGIGYGVGVETTDFHLAVDGDILADNLKLLDFAGVGNRILGVSADGTLTGTVDSYHNSNWDTAYSWGDWSTQGFLTSETSHADVVVDGDFTSNGLLMRTSSGVYGIVTSGTDIKTINGTSLLGSGNITITGSIWNYDVQTLIGSTPTWNVENGLGANIYTSGNHAITLTNLEAGMCGDLSIYGDGNIRTITFLHATAAIEISRAILDTGDSIKTSGGSDEVSWRFDGVKIKINGQLNLG